MPDSYASTMAWTRSAPSYGVLRDRVASSVERTARNRSSPSNGFARNAVAGSSDPAIVVSPV